MAKKRQNEPGTVVAVTRRTIMGATYFGVDAARATSLFLFLLAHFSKQFALDVISAALMSNHCHMVLYDRKGLVSDFCKEFFRTTAVAWKVFLKTAHPELVVNEIWDSRRPDIDPLTHEQAFVAKTLYVMLNPVHHRVVEQPEDYVNFVTTFDMLQAGKQQKPYRPRYYLSQDDQVWEPRETLTFKAPPGYSRAEWLRVLEYNYEAYRADMLARDEARTGIPAEEPIPGERNLPKQDVRFVSRPKSQNRSRFSGPPSTRNAAEQRYGRFFARYQQAFEDMIAGNKVLFPPGTTGLRMFHGVQPEQLSQEEQEARLRALRAPLSENELRYPTRISLFEE